MKKLSGFDIGMIIAFVVIALLGGGAWYYMDGQFSATQQDVASASSDFERYSSKMVYLPTAGNAKTLQANIDVMQAQLDPLIHDVLQASGNKLAGVKTEDTVAWKHDLDAEMTRLNTAAKREGVKVPDNFYYGFSRYLNTNPGDEQTLVLSKQLYGVEEIAKIFIDAPVKGISTFRRTYEEDPVSNSPGGARISTDPDMLPGNAHVAPGNVYTAYPFEIQFEATTDGLRKVLNGLQKSPYVFITRSLIIENSSPNSPQISDLDKMAGAAAPGASDSSSGATTNTPPNKGPQFLFGDEHLNIKIRIDMIEWHGVAVETGPALAPRPRNHTTH